MPELFPRVKLKSNPSLVETSSLPFINGYDRGINMYCRILDITTFDLMGQRILDIGSGVHRRFAREAASILGAQVVSIDPVPTQDRINYQATDPDPDIDRGATIADPEEYELQALYDEEEGRLVRALATDLPFADDQFDVGLALYSVPFYLSRENYEEASAAVFTEIMRVLRPGGTAHIYPIIGPLEDERPEPDQYPFKGYSRLAPAVSEFLDSTASDVRYVRSPDAGNTFAGNRLFTLNIKKSE